MSFLALHPSKSWRLLWVALAAAVVFLFAFHAKTGVYGRGSDVKVTATTSAKLWLNGQKADVKPRIQTGTLSIWFALLLLHLSFVWAKSGIRNLFDIAPPPRLALDYRRFLRPPPVR